MVSKQNFIVFWRESQRHLIPKSLLSYKYQCYTFLLVVLSLWFFKYIFTDYGKGEIETLIMKIIDWLPPTPPYWGLSSNSGNWIETFFWFIGCRSATEPHHPGLCDLFINDLLLEVGGLTALNICRHNVILRVMVRYMSLWSV